MCSNKFLRLSHRLELAHPSLPGPGRLMRLFDPIIVILLSAVDRFRDQFTVSDTIAS